MRALGSGCVTFAADRRLPFWVAVGTIVAVAKECTIAVERDPGSFVSKAD